MAVVGVAGLVTRSAVQGVPDALDKCMTSSLAACLACHCLLSIRKPYFGQLAASAVCHHTSVQGIAELAEQ